MGDHPRPTCTVEGSQERTCECGEKEIQTIAALPHTESEWVTDLVATMIDKGSQSAYCTVCQTTLTRELPQKVSDLLSYEVNPDGKTCTVTGRKLWGEMAIGIPEEIDGYKVTAIGPHAFANKFPGYTHIYIPEGVTHIGAGAFAGTEYVNVSLPNSLEYIADDAIQAAMSGKYNEYDNAYYLGNKENPYIILIKAKNLDIASCEIHPDTKFITTHAFNQCEKLTTITIPDRVVQIGCFAFHKCTSLSAIRLPQGITEIA